jgi:hypothetical protein
VDRRPTGPPANAPQGFDVYALISFGEGFRSRPIGTPRGLQLIERIQSLSSDSLFVTLMGEFALLVKRPLPFAAGTSPPGSRTARPNLRVETLIRF